MGLVGRQLSGAGGLLHAATAHCSQHSTMPAAVGCQLRAHIGTNCCANVQIACFKEGKTLVRFCNILIQKF
jgi:hypothetical protein